MTVYTRELDDILYEHPAVEFAAAIGVTDPEQPRSERVLIIYSDEARIQGEVKG